MPTDLEHELRATFNALADEARPADLAASAWRGGGRIRLRRNATTAVVAVVVAGAVAVPFAVAWDSPATGPLNPAPPATASQLSPSGPAPATPPSRRPIPALDAGAVTLPGGWLVASSPGRSGTWVYDRAQRRYRQISYDRAVPAPVGDLVAVQRSADQRVGLLNLRTGKVTWVSGPSNVVGTADWSPDGSRLVYPGAGTADASLRLVVVDATTARATTLPTNIECYENCAPYWLANGTDIALPQLERPMEGLRVFSASDGRARPPVAVAALVGTAHAWSPDGRFVVGLGSDGATTATYVVEVATGRRVAPLPHAHPNAVYWAGTDRVLVVGEHEISILTLGGTPVEVAPLPTEFTPEELPQVVLAQQ
jgi:hypothetical protein